MYFIVDAHEDIAWNIASFGRDYSRPAEETRRGEAEGLAPQVNGDTLLGYADWVRGGVGLVFGTLFAAPMHRRVGEWDTQSYADFRQARRLYSQQLDAYSQMADDHPDLFRLVKETKDLEAVLAAWEKAPAQESESPDGQPAPQPPVGLVVLMEGGEAINEAAEVEDWWARGVRYIGPAWAGTRFCGGTREPGPLTKDGYALLEAMAGFGFGLDLSHMDEEAALQALDAYPGQVVASHANAKALIKGTDSNRHLTDRVIRGLIERDCVIGIVPFNLFLVPGWRMGDRRELGSLQQVVAHIDYICQMAGDARHVGIGSDFDGGFGVQSVPPEIDTVADLQKIAPLLKERGYGEADIAAVMGGNWIERLRSVLAKV